jgi:hypothetical protein
MSTLTTGYENMALGTNALGGITTDGQNVGIGSRALISLYGGGIGNVGIGYSALGRLGAGGAAPSNNIAIGGSAGASLNAAYQNTVIGGAAFETAVTSSGNIVIGSAAAQNVTGGDLNVIIGTNWTGPSASFSNAIILNIGNNSNNIAGADYNYTASNVWSFQKLANAHGLHIYNTTDGLTPPTNYERGILDWTATANTFRLGTQAGGTGTVRLIAIDGFQKAGAPAAGDLPPGTFALINDTSGGQTWLAYNAAGTIRKVQLT